MSCLGSSVSIIQNNNKTLRPRSAGVSKVSAHWFRTQIDHVQGEFREIEDILLYSAGWLLGGSGHVDRRCVNYAKTFRRVPLNFPKNHVQTIGA